MFCSALETFYARSKNPKLYHKWAIVCEFSLYCTSLGLKSPISCLRRGLRECNHRAKISGDQFYIISTLKMRSFLYKNYCPSISEPKNSKIYMSLGLKSSISHFKSGLRGVNHKSKKVRQPKLLDIRPKYNTYIHEN